MKRLVVVLFFISMLMLSCAPVNALLTLGNNIASKDICSDSWNNNEWIKIADNTYAFVARYDTDETVVNIVYISSDGATITAVAQQRFDRGTSSQNPDIECIGQVWDEMEEQNESIFAIVNTIADNDGEIFTIGYYIEGEYFSMGGVIDSWEFDTTNGEDICVNLVNTTSDVNNTVLVCYAGDGQDGWARTINISNTGTIWKSYVASLEFDTSHAWHLRDVKMIVDGKHFVVSNNRGSTTVYARILEITENGKTITVKSSNNIWDGYSSNYAYASDISVNSLGNAVFHSWSGGTSGLSLVMSATINLSTYGISAKDAHVGFFFSSISDASTYDKSSVEFINDTEIISIAQTKALFGTLNLTSGNINWMDWHNQTTLGGKWVNILTPLNSDMNDGHIAIAYQGGNIYTYHVIDYSLCPDCPDCPECPECNSTNLTVNELENNCTLNLTQDYNSTNGWTVNVSCDGNCSGGGLLRQMKETWPGIGLMLALAMMCFTAGYLIHEDKKKKKKGGDKHSRLPSMESKE